jgi:hypothetical protein
MRSTLCLIALCVLALISFTSAQMVKDSNPESAASVQAAVLDCLEANNDESFCIALLHVKQNNSTESNVRVQADGACEKNATDMTCQEHIHLAQLNETAPASPSSNQTTKIDELFVESSAETHEFAEVHGLAAPVQRRRSPVTRALWFIVIITVLPLLCCCGVSYAIYQLMCGGYYSAPAGGSTYV